MVIASDGRVRGSPSEDVLRCLARRVELPGRGTTRVWECPGPPGAETLLLIHGVTFTAELNWRRVMDPLGRHFRIVAFDQRGHGQATNAGERFSLEDCADDIAALAGVLHIDRFIAAGYSMGGIVAQLLSRRHRSLLSGLVLCSTAGTVCGSPLESMFALALSTVGATLCLNPLLQVADAEALGAVLLGHIPNSETREWARQQLRRTSLRSALSAIQAVCEFTSEDWIGRVGVPAAVVITTRDRIVPASGQRRLARAIPGAVVYELEADHGVCVNAPELFARVLLEASQRVAAAPNQLASGRTQRTDVVTT
jgi:pimeloyl-ACP methyl ester carboxylesterase